MINYEYVLRKFKEYISSFDMKEKGIALKTSHSYHVADISFKLAKRLELNKEEIELAKVIGLLHDLGRFPQYQQTKSFSDHKTHIDHAELAVRYLFEEEHIKEFNIPEKYYDIIKCAIDNHNKLEIIDNLNEKELFYAKLIRDADKIDIFRAEATGYDLKYDKPASKKIKDALKKHKLIDSKIKENNSDSIIQTLAYVFDLNFKESFELLDETDNLELFISVMDVSKELEEEWQEIISEVRNYLKERIDENVR